MSSDPSKALDALSTSFTVLESALAPFLATPLEDILAQNDGEPLQKAKLQVMMSYVVHDLVWIYLRTSGVDPANHPVMQELTRLKSYFDKIQNAESSSDSAPQLPGRDGPRFTVDKAAAARFINAAIVSQKSKVDPFYIAPEHSTDANAEAGSSTGVHTRFDEAATKLLESSGEDGSDDDDEDGMVVTKAVPADAPLDDDDEMLIVEKVGGDEEDELIVEDVAEELIVEKLPAGNKKPRPKMDPFAGYDQPKSAKGKGAKTDGKQPGETLSKHQRKKLAAARKKGSPAK